jgi:hypothetical protein
MSLTKLGVAAFVLFIVDIWSAANKWVLSINPWYFLLISIILAAIVVGRIFK